MTNECDTNKKKENVILEVCSRNDKRYVSFRNRHYIPNRGCHGQQIHFLIHYKGEHVGIISGASSVYAVGERDKFFNIPQDKTIKQKRYLPAIINNVVFRLECHEKNLGTRVLAKFRRVSAQLWKSLYGVDVIGFETFVIENERRKGSMYKADNWTYLGETKGSTKTHSGLLNKSERKDTEIKMIFAVKTKKNLPTTDYVSSWRASTEEEKQRAKTIATMKKRLIGKMF
jgi:hypothetical protein